MVITSELKLAQWQELKKNRTVAPSHPVCHHMYLCDRTADNRGSRLRRINFSGVLVVGLGAAVSHWAAAWSVAKLEMGLHARQTLFPVLRTRIA